MRNSGIACRASPTASGCTQARGTSSAAYAAKVSGLPVGVLYESSPSSAPPSRFELRDGRRLVAQVDGVNGHSGKQPPELHFGLGDVDPTAKLPIEIRWRSTAGEWANASFFQPIEFRHCSYAATFSARRGTCDAVAVQH